MNLQVKKKNPLRGVFVATICYGGGGSCRLRHSKPINEFKKRKKPLLRGRRRGWHRRCVVLW